MAANTIDWPGKSGKNYRYWFLEALAADKIIAAGGNYMFVKRLPNGNWIPVYIGEASDLKERLPSHERWGDAKKQGASHVMAHTTPAGAETRIAEESDLIEYWNPPLNTQHRQAS